MTALTHQPRFVDQLRQNEQTIMELQQRIKELEDGLRPFVNAAQHTVHNLPDTVAIWAKTDRAADNGLVAEITIGDLKRAASLLPVEKTNE